MSRTAIQRNKKIQSQKGIKLTAPLLSQLHIELPKTNIRKISLTKNLEIKISQYHDISDVNHPLKKIERVKSIENQKNISKQRISTVSSSKILPFQMQIRSQNEVIQQWVLKLFNKKKLMGPQWQAKLKQKKLKILKQAFDYLKKQRQNNEQLFLQTHSKYKPLSIKFNHLITIGLERLEQIVFKIKINQKKYTFSKILRYLAFQYSTPKKKPLISAKSIPLSNHMLVPNQQRQYSPMNHKINHIKLLEHPPYHKNNQYQSNKKIQFATPKKLGQSSKQINFTVNQYALAPVALMKQKNPDAKVIKDNQFFGSESKFLRQIPIKNLSNSRSQPHLAIGNIGGNFKYQFNQHNYILLKPEHLSNFRSNNQNFITTPPSPNAHHQIFHNIISQNQFKSNFLPIENFCPVSQQAHQKLHQERSKIKISRPQTHVPIPCQNNTIFTDFQIRNTPIEAIPNRKSRALSFSMNIKRPADNQEYRYEQNNFKKGDYEDLVAPSENRVKLDTKIGENLQVNPLRQNFGDSKYQAQSPRGPNYIFSAPTSPNTIHQLHKIHELNHSKNIPPPMSPIIYQPSNKNQPYNNEIHLPSRIYKNGMVVQNMETILTKN